jgi:hypothetical protein
MNPEKYDVKRWLFSANPQDRRGAFMAKAIYGDNGANANGYIYSKFYRNQYGLSDNSVSPDFLRWLIDTAKHVKKAESTPMNQNGAQVMYDNVFSKENSLSQSDRQFYDTYVQIVDSNRQVIDPANYNRIDPSTSYIKYKTENINGQPVLTIAHRLPNFDPQYDIKSALRRVVSGPIADGLLEQDDIANPRIFEDIFMLAYNNDQFNANNSNGNQTQFDFKSDEYVQDRLYKLGNAQVADDSTPNSADNFPKFNLDQSNCGIITRKADGKMYRTVNGREEPVSHGDPETDRLLKMGNKCYGTYVSSDPVQCKKFIFECILSHDPKDLNKCFEVLMQSPNIDQAFQSDIKNLHPLLAQRILQKFGFRTFVDSDSNGIQIDKVECVSKWLKHFVAANHTPQQMQQMLDDGKSAHILSYLDLLVQYVNCNPAVLNKNYVADSNQARQLLPATDYASRLGITVSGRDGKVSTKDEFNFLKNNIDLQRAQSSTPWNPSRINGIPGSSLYPFGSFASPGSPFAGQMGGGTKCDNVIGQFNANGKVSGGQMLDSYIKSITADLERKGKVLSPNTKANIEKNLNQLKQIEQELLRTLCYMEEVDNSLTVFGNTIPNVIDQDTLKKLAKRYETISGKQMSTEDKILALISKLADMNGDGDMNSKPLELVQ